MIRWFYLTNPIRQGKSLRENRAPSPNTLFWWNHCKICSDIFLDFFRTGLPSNRASLTKYWKFEVIFCFFAIIKAWKIMQQSIARKKIKYELNERRLCFFWWGNLQCVWWVWKYAPMIISCIAQVRITCLRHHHRLRRTHERHQDGEGK